MHCRQKNTQRSELKFAINNNLEHFLNGSLNTSSNADRFYDVEGVASVSK